MLFIKNNFKTKKFKKSQIEIVGLLIIVLIISFIILFAATSFSKKKNNVTESVKKESLAADMISAILYTSTNCTPYNVDMTDILTECVKWQNSGSAAVCKNGQSYCEFFNTTVKNMLDDTFQVWSTTYEMIITRPNGDFENNLTWLMHFSGGNFSESINSMAADQPLSLGEYGDINIRLCIGGKCGG